MGLSNYSMQSINNNFALRRKKRFHGKKDKKIFLKGQENTEVAPKLSKFEKEEFEKRMKKAKQRGVKREMQIYGTITLIVISISSFVWFSFF